MAKKVREEAIALSSYLKSVNSEDISENQDVQRMFCWDNPAINELILTVLTEDYIPPIILGEEELGGGLTQEYIVDGIQRTTALNKFRHMNWKTTKSFENSIIQYQAKKRDEEGHLIKGEDGSILWDSCEFNIANKTFDQLPDELKKKFDDYQIRIVIHQNCTMQEISKLVRRYNRNKSMGSNQKALTWIPTYARKIKSIVCNAFYRECVTYSDANRKNGTYEQTVANAVMATFHMNDWKKTPKDRNEFLETYSSVNEFNIIEEYGNRIEKVCKNRNQNVFSFKDIPVWFAVFHNFTKYGLDDNKFSEFVDKISTDLSERVVGEYSYDSLDKESGTSDKRIVMAKIETYTALMEEFLNIDPKTTEEDEENSDESVLSFVQKNVNADITDEDVELYEDMIDDCVKIDSPVYTTCRAALIAIMAYACLKDQDMSFEDWIRKYERNNVSFSHDQKVNYTYMKCDFDKFVEAAVA